MNDFFPFFSSAVHFDSQNSAFFAHKHTCISSHCVCVFEWVTFCAYIEDLFNKKKTDTQTHTHGYIYFGRDVKCTYIYKPFFIFFCLIVVLFKKRTRALLWRVSWLSVLRRL